MALIEVILIKNNMQSAIIFVSIFLIVIMGISTITFVNVNAQGEGGANQTIEQQEDPQHSDN
jgi:hypothetical protein